MKWTKLLLANLLVLMLALAVLTQSTPKPAGTYDRARAYTRMVEFDYLEWALQAMQLKNLHEAVAAPRYLSVEDQRKVVFEYLRIVRWVNQTNARINRIYADPNIRNPEEAAAELNEQIEVLRGMEERIQPLAESILQHQVSTLLAEMDLGLGGQPIPPVMYHVTRLPYALILSPRDVIRQDGDISLTPALTTAEINALENQVASELDVSALVVPVGGVGIYPTMVMSTTNLPWLLETIAHEWIHNYLTLRPLGMNYLTSPQIRTINETTANLAGKEIGRAVLERYYPELAPPPTPTPEPTRPNQPTPTPTPEDPNVFNFNREMRETRVQVDQMLKDGQIEEAEAYMESRRAFFWENGYQIRKLNQAYFAFYGAYADSPGGGAAGADPIGPAVVQFREQNPSLAEFLRRIAWVTSFEQLQALLD